MIAAFVLDASVAVSWAVPDEDSGLAEHVAQLARHAKAHVPPHWPSEVAHAMLLLVRKSRISSTDADLHLARLSDLDLTIDAPRPPAELHAARDLAVSFGTSIYDAMYLELALRLSLPLATIDQHLAACATKAGLPPIAVT